jgi:hypothetical protein
MASLPDEPHTLPSGDTREDSESPLYSTANRWRSYLRVHSVAYRTLQAEREQGWQSSALDAWYAQRQAPPVRHSPSNTANDALKSSAASPNTSSTGAAPRVAAPAVLAIAATPATVGTTSFVAADVCVLAERYRQHAFRITQLAAKHFFVRPPPPSAASPLFLDLGCAPGGVSKYLLEDLHWRGVGVTLPSTSGGIEVDPALVDDGAHQHDYLLLDGDVTQAPETWRRSAVYAQLATSNPAMQETKASAKTSTDVPVLSEAVFQADTHAVPAFHFVNGGAVLDHGQRQQWAKSLEEKAQHVAVDNSKGQTRHDTATAAHTLGPILPWFSLLVPQLRIALTYTAQGGAMMLVHGAPHCASLFILLRCMEEVVGARPDTSATESTTPCGCHVRLLETMHLAKPPVYVLWTNVWPADAAAGNAPPLSRESSAAAQRRLLAALDPASPRISPLEPDAADEAFSHDGRSHHSALEEKQRFWLGESEEGFRLAVEGFTRYGNQVEAIWTRVEAFLRRRRERAEREMVTRSSIPQRFTRGKREREGV